MILKEGGLGFARAWQLSRGNTLRLGTAVLLTVGPLWALDAYAYHLVANTWPAFPMWDWTGFACGESVDAYFAWLEQVSFDYPAAILPIDLVRHILESAIIAGLIASAYTQLAENK